MIWFGPYGTVSPLHYDPLDNLYMQMVGSKHILLYAPSDSMGNNTDKYSDFDDHDQDYHKDSNWYYAGANGEQYNTSPINVEDPDLNLYPNFARAPPAMEGIVNPGDVVYIPKKWWHHVRSLKTSISVNTWWR